MLSQPFATASAPVVSVITPTWNREALLPFAYRSVAAQREVALEWIVIDDSAAPSAFMRELTDLRVIYRHVPQRMTVGEKRNLAVELARGDVIAHFDDDEVYAPRYLSTMLGQMHRHEAEFAKLGAFFVYSRVYGQFGYWDLMRKSGLHFCWSGRPMTLLNFPHDNPAFADNHLGYGFSYLYTKRLWAAQPFEPRSFNEDGLFAAAARSHGARMTLLADDIGLCLHVLHAHNTSKSYPQFLLPDVLVERHFPHFCEALAAAAMRSARAP
ncbi:glycosyltransferase family 2 protein [Paraburkholderia acidisoli]|uniref:Glycosyltransferase n=1 Tax=Paraburkholderia acidisoli TaxID=2571748 RepID=A0A7Z2GIX5_9BURK|nr:glycosyltransferase family 2 protein [Paraburkholderia acidisoli]QGZ62627.1 glycosyltransferase [Paraburkholderia acidisoli]